MPGHPNQPAAFKWDSSNILLAVILSLFLLFVVLPVLMNVLMVGPINKNMHGLNCQSNLKQLGLALIQYEQDSDGVEPVVTSTGNGWREAVFPYVKSTGVYECPDDVRTGDPPPVIPRSYAANHLGPDSRRHERGAFSGPGEAAANLYQLDHPATTILLTDTRGEVAEEWNMINPAFLPSHLSNELYVHIPQHLVFERVTGTLNILMGDGHIKHIKPLDTLTPINLWTRDNAQFTGQDLTNAQAILQHAQDE